MASVVRPESLTLRFTVPAAPERVYSTWLTGKTHSAMTGAAATGSARVGTKLTAWDGYIVGKNLELEVGRRIVQTWRTTDFEPTDPDSRLEISFEAVAPDATEVTLVHTNLPRGGAKKYRTGWQQFYVEPMREYFARTGAP